MASKGGRAYCKSDGIGCSQLYQCTLHLFPLHAAFLGFCLHGCSWTHLWFKAREEETLSRENQTHFTYSSVFIHILVVVPIFGCLFFFHFFKFPNLLEFWLTSGLNLPASVMMITNGSLTCNYRLLTITIYEAAPPSPTVQNWSPSVSLGATMLYSWSQNLCSRDMRLYPQY